MPVKKLLRTCLLLLLVAGSLLACDILPGTGTAKPGGTSSVVELPTGTPELDTWYSIASGVEVRYEHWKGPSKNEDDITIVRMTPSKVRLSVGYQPDNPLTMREWMKETKARVLLNGGYFDKNNRPTGLLVSNGEVTGESYSGFGGMLAVDSEGKMSLRSLNQSPYDPNSENLTQATQSSPMLIINGKRTDFQADASTGRRTIVAMDKKGRLIFLVSPSLAFSLDEIADLLVDSDLGLQTALNLDGGSSTGLYVNTSKQKINIDPISSLPIVIIVK